MPTSYAESPDTGVIGYNSPSGTAVIRCKSNRWRKRSWSNTLNYATRDPLIILPVNSYVDEQYSVSQPIMIRIVSVSGTQITHDGRTATGLDALLTDYASIANSRLRSESSQLNEATLKCLAKISDMKVNFAVTLAEASKTSSLILGTASRIAKALRQFRRGNFKGVAQTLNLSPSTVHKSWLEYSYGWLPLLSEVKGSAELLAQHHVGRPQRFTVSANVSDITDISESSALEGWNRMTRQISYERRCRVKILAEISNPLQSSLQQMGLTNPALVAWELIPYSFVFDWFISVGDWLQGLSALDGIVVKRSFRSFEKTMSASRYGQQNATSTDRSYDSLIRFAYRAYQRDSIAISPSSLYPPVNDEPFNWRRTLTSLALLRANAPRGLNRDKLRL